MATRMAYQTFRRVYSDPGAALRSDAFDERSAHYGLLWQYYQNSAFDDLAQWATYRSRYRLYRYSRSLYNPVRRLVDFYAGVVYQGAWPTKPAGMTERSAAVPFDEATDATLLAAIAQAWEWSNWPSKSALMTRYGAALGDVLVVVVDDVSREKVFSEVVYPGHVADITTNAAGDVIAYTLEYTADDADGQSYSYRRSVDKESIRTYRDGQPFGYDEQPAEIDNPYGFVPACWINHTPAGGVHGEPAVRTLGKIDELNSLASHALDQAHRVLAAPILIAGENVEGLNSTTKSAQSGSNTTANADVGGMENIKLIKGATGATIETIRLEPGEALEHIDRMLREIEADHPELTMFTKLREMSQVTGPGADRMFGDVAALVNGARTQYDRQLVKLCQMQAAIGGWRLNSGGWPSRTNQQQAFAPFGLDSYESGALELSIQARVLVPVTEQEQIELEKQRGGLATDRSLRTLRSDNAPASIAARLRTMAEATA